MDTPTHIFLRVNMDYIRLGVTGQAYPLCDGNTKLGWFLSIGTCMVCISGRIPAVSSADHRRRVHTYSTQRPGTLR